MRNIRLTKKERHKKLIKTKKTPLISIIILNWNGKDLLNRCLNSIIVNTNYKNYEILVVDNSSVDGSAQFVEEKFPKIKLIKLPENVGFSKGNNIGVKYAKGDYVLILNNDTEIVDKNWLNNAIELFESDEKIGVIGCKLIYPNGKLQHAGGRINFLNPSFISHIGSGENQDKVEYNRFYEPNYVTGAAMFIKKEVIEKRGLFDEIFTPVYYEDPDFCIRAKRAGYKVIYAPNIKLIHYESTTTKKYKNKYIVFIWIKNKYIFCLLDMPLKYFPIRTFYEFFVMIKWILKGQGKSYFKALWWIIKNFKLIIKKRYERKQGQIKIFI